MILAEKITEERKKNGWSQEELAERLGVSRQAVSKWESAGSIPDLKKVIQMADLFGVSTDYLLKDELVRTEPAAYTAAESENDSPIRRVSLEEANEFLEIKRKHAPIIANGVAMCVLSPALLIILGTMADDRVFHITNTLAAAAGYTFLFGMIAAAVYMFITCGTHMSPMEHLEKEVFETEYGVTGMVKERRRSYDPVFSRGIAIGVVLCILSVVPLIFAGALGAADYICGLFTAMMLLMIALGVNIIIRVSIVKESYDTLLQEGDYTKEEKHLNKKVETISGAYWCLATAGYLGWSFWTMRWDFTWIVWPVAGVLYAALRGILKLAFSNKE